MQRLSGMDASHLSMETATTPMHVVGVLILDLGPGADPGSKFEVAKAMLAERIHLMPAFRRRLVEVPLGLDFPRWVDDPDFDLEQHVQRVAVPPPGDLRALGRLVGDIAGRRLDRGRPLWELWVVEGLEGGQVAIVTKVHHAAIDGASGADLMVNLFDLTPEVRAVDPPTAAFAGERAPSDLRLLGTALVRQAFVPLRAATQLGRSAGNLAGTARRALGRGDGGATLPFSAPRTPFSGALTPHRAVAFARVPLADLKDLKNAYGGKVNDVILALTSHALRGWLLDHGGLPDKPLVASCPISVRKEGAEAATNQISAMLVPLPVHLADPGEALREIIASTKRSKDLANALGAETLQDWAEFLAPRLFNSAMQLYSTMRLGNLHRPLQNLIVSNVPGPPLPLYCAGARVEAIYPMGPLLPGAGLNITVLSNMGNVDVGMMACRETVPDLWDIADAFPAAVATLGSA